MQYPLRSYTSFCKSITLAIASIGLLALAAVGPAQAQGSANGIVNSPHDFSGALWNFRGEICRTCHVPHDHAQATKLFTNGLLWNHQVSAATYTLYDSAWSATIDNATGAPDGTSKLCLGCHDGSVGINQFDRDAGVAGTDFIALGFQVSSFNDGANIDLRGTHPLSIVYDEAVDPGLNAKTTAMGTSGTIAEVLDSNSKVQCSTCHDVHDGAGEAVNGSHLLRVAQTVAQLGSPSGLCLTCHKK